RSPVRIVVDAGLRLPLTAVFQAARSRYGQLDGDGALADLMPFLADRLKVHLRESGVRHDLIQAIFALGGEDDLLRLLARVDALSEFLASEDGGNLLTAFRRAANIVAAEAKKADLDLAGALDEARFADPAEHALAAALSVAEQQLSAALADENFAAAMAALAALRAPLDTFFEDVTVNAADPDLRLNRLRLLARIGGAMGQVADFAQIEG
ncbi:MAG: DALR anticodon-binding domain-containing protein, partial [Thalassobaculaceae bacterium]